jgi:uncharacterized protein (TIGR02413 family)
MFLCGIFYPLKQAAGNGFPAAFALKEVRGMTLNILFLTITIKKRKISHVEADHQEVVEKLFEEHKDRQLSIFKVM